MNPFDLLPRWLGASDDPHGFCADTLWWIVLFPFLGFLFNAFAHKKINARTSGFIATLMVALSFTWACVCFAQMAHTDDRSKHALNLTPEALHGDYGTWMNLGWFEVRFGFYMDQLSGIMALVVTGIGALIHLYSIGYMAHDKSPGRYFAYLNLFLVAMLILVLADNLVLMFVGWEGVGLCSYLLIGFWYEDREKAEAGTKAFLFNRVGDLGFVLGIFTLAAVFGTSNFVSPAPLAKNVAETATAEKKVVLPPSPGLLDYANGLKRLAEKRGSIALDFKAQAKDGNLDLSQHVGAKVFPGMAVGGAILIACVLLFIGAMGKSAQLPLYAWLPDAMAGPTPVSALIHAATMVTAGVYMVCRLHPLFSFSPEALQLVAVIGGATAIFAALIGLTQTDIKKVLAYSTVSQLGYMFLAAGVGSYSLAMFHVVTHAFFKALLFLGAGSVIHALSGEQELYRMGGLWKKLPLTCWTFVIGALALSGFPGTAGWYSKDAIMAACLAKAETVPEHEKTIYLVLYALAVIGAFCTAFYTFRLVSLAFFGNDRLTPEAKAHLHESPLSMTLPLAILAVLALLGGVLFEGRLLPFLALPGGPENHEAHHLNLIIAGVAAIGGIALAIFIYAVKKKVPNIEAGAKNPLWNASRNQFYFDWFYMVFVRGAYEIVSEVLHFVIEVLLIQFLIVGGVEKLTRMTSRGLRQLQSGLMNAYAAGILAGALAILWLVLRNR